MTEVENQFLRRLITAAWPLSLQIAFAIGLCVIYYFWSLFYYRLIDPVIRTRIGNAQGVLIVWVLRHSGSYQTSFELSFNSTRYLRWSWGIANESQRTFFKDGKVWLLSFLLINLIGGLWPITIFFYVFLGLKALSYVVFLPTCLIMIFIYSVFWSGRHEVKGMQKA